MNTSIKTYCVCWNRNTSSVQVILKGEGRLKSPAAFSLEYDSLAKVVADKIEVLMKEAEESGHWFTLSVETLKSEANAFILENAPEFLVFNLSLVNKDAFIDYKEYPENCRRLSAVLAHYRSKLEMAMSGIFSSVS